MRALPPDAPGPLSHGLADGSREVANCTHHAPREASSRGRAVSWVERSVKSTLGGEFAGVKEDLRLLSSGGGAVFRDPRLQFGQ